MVCPATKVWHLRDLAEAKTKKGHEFKERYTIFMSKLLSKGYTKSLQFIVNSYFIFIIMAYTT